MAQVNVDMQRVLDLYDTIHYRTLELVVQKEQSRKLQDEILNNYDNYRSAIERAFINLNERK
jgi:serine/threonine-protein kinase